MKTGEHILQAGESLGALAAEVYGEMGGFRDIADANGIDIFEVLPVGRNINIPPLATVREAIEKTAKQAAAISDKVDNLDLSVLKQHETILQHQLISWIL